MQPFDEDFVLAEAALITEDQGTEVNIDDNKSHASEEAAQEGRDVESGMASTTLRHWQSCIKAEPPELAGALLKLASGSHTASRAAAAQLVATHEAEQKIVRRIVTMKEQNLAAARQAVERGALALMKLDLQRKKSAAILLGIKHLAVVKMVRATDESIEVPVGDLLTTAIDQISKLQLEINRRQS